MSNAIVQPAIELSPEVQAIARKLMPMLINTMAPRLNWVVKNLIRKEIGEVIDMLPSAGDAPEFHPLRILCMLLMVLVMSEIIAHTVFMGNVAAAKEIRKRFVKARNSRSITDAQKSALPDEFFLMCLLDDEEEERVLGDIADRFEKNVQRRGAKKALFLFHCQSIREIWPGIMRAVQKSVQGTLIAHAIRFYLKKRGGAA